MDINELKLQSLQFENIQGSIKESKKETVSQSFQESLRKTSVKSGLSFSKHAAKRLSERGIELTDGMKSDLENAVESARQKGAKEVAVIGRNGIFIVNVPNNVVVTTMTQEDMKNRIFTNIDSAVIV